MRQRFVETLCDLAEKDPRVMLITADLGFGVLDVYRVKFPRQFINVGVAEQSMVLVAAGMALEGHVVFGYSIGNFPTLRCLEMLRNDAAYHDANVNIVAVGGGFSYGQLGFSHHATEDIAILRALSGVTVFAPTGPSEVECATRTAASLMGTTYLRLDKDPGAEGSDAPFHSGLPRLIRDGRDAAMFVTGGIMSQAEGAADLLLAADLSVAIYAVHTLKPIDTPAVAEIARRYPLLISIEEHSLSGGLGSALLEALADEDTLPPRVLRLGLPDVPSRLVGTQEYLRAIHGLDAASIAARVRKALAK